MRTTLFTTTCLLIFTLCCGRPEVGNTPEAQTLSVQGTTIGERFLPPNGFVLVPIERGSFGQYLRDLALEQVGTPVHLFDGSLKHRQNLHAAVVAISVGNTDLQQCADAVMRLRAEYLFANGRFENIHFNFTNGFRAEFSRWVNGERIQVQGKTCLWKGEGSTQRDHANLMSFLQKVFTYAGTLSLDKELNDATTSPLQIGDVFIHGGSPGHAMLVVDVAKDPNGQQAFLLAQSYMPAQQIHVVKNLHHPEMGAWFILNGDDQLYTPEWTFAWDNRKRWP